ncbi:MAG: large conductance mechanosensitive channel protein MscL [Rickettsiales bacterium]|jgi:large conductance mechanosensitive channel|nr:large conductance mechanosensitive channel protein MscL [Rickettsiales bacterium]
MSFFGEFKKFAMRGNVIDMAVGIIIGGAFGKIVDSLVKDIMMPGIGMLLGRVDFSNIFIVLQAGKHHPEDGYASLAQAVSDGAVTINIGTFINTSISFIIMAFAVFLMVRAINKLESKFDTDKDLPPTKKLCPECFEMIDIRAYRCPFCTALIEKKPSKNDLKKRMDKGERK